MSHSVTVTLIADQVIRISGRDVNIHDIKAIVLNGYGVIEEVRLFPHESAQQGNVAELLPLVARDVEDDAWGNGTQIP